VGTIVLLDQPSAEAADTGGKGASLIRLARAGFPVPPGFVVTTDGYRRFVAANDLAAAIDVLLDTPDLRLPRVARDAVQPLTARLEQAALPPDLGGEIAAAYAALRARGVGAVAVRSSARSEDGSLASSAGLYETYLNLSDQVAVLHAVRDCYCSVWSARAVQYRALKGVDQRSEAMAAVVMALVPADVSGVAFSANPVTGDRGQIVVNASWGLGEAIVSGRVTPDHFVVAKGALAVVERHIYDKTVAVVPDPSHPDGAVEVAVERDRAPLPSLSDADLHTVAEATEAIERLWGRPVDVEWAFAGGAFSVLQARPITTIA
jgi:rifampicin phosphotransferase